MERSTVFVRERIFVREIGVALALIFLAPSLASAQLNWEYADRELDVSADYSIDASYIYSFDTDFDQDQTNALGAWASTREAEVFPWEQAPNGIGRASVDSDINGDGITFSSRLFTDGGNYSVSGGDPEDIGSYYYTDEWSSGTASSGFTVSFHVPDYQQFWLDADAVGDIGSGRVRLRSDLYFGTIIPGDQQIHLDLAFGGGSTGLHETSVLLPNRLYTLVFDHDSTSGSNGLDLVFVVPEPSTALLIGLGLAGISGTTRRRRA